MSRSLTYAELANALKITPESANRLVHRTCYNPVHAQTARVESELAGMREALGEVRARPDAADASEEAAAARADAEAAKTAQAIRAFESLAERLDAMAEAQNAKALRRWWRRIVRRG
jgi:hypothetical protein